MPQDIAHRNVLRARPKGTAFLGILASLAFALSLHGCKSRTFNTAKDGAALKSNQGQGFQLKPYDLAFNFSAIEKLSDVPFNLSSILDDQNFQTVLKAGFFFVPETFVSESRVPKLDPLTGRPILNPPGPSDTATFSDGASDDWKACLRSASNWLPVAARFAPYETSVFGPADVQNAWAKKKGHAELTRLVHLRLTFHPHCPRQDTKLSSGDAAMHVVFELRPNDAALFNGIVAGTKFSLAQASGKSEIETRPLLDAYAAAVTSPAYAEWRRQIVADWKVVADAKTADGLTDASFAPLVSHFAELRKDFVTEASMQKSNVFPHPATKPGSKTQAEFAAFVKKYATRRNLQGASTLTASGGGEGGFPWMFAVTLASPSEGLLHATRGKSFGLIESNDSLKIVSLQEAPLQSVNGKFAGLPTDPTARKLLDGQESAAYGSHPVKTANPNVRTELAAKFLDTSKSNFTTNSCQHCHAIVEMGKAKDGSLRVSAEQYNFHLLSRGRWNARTVVEIEEEAHRLVAEMEGTASSSSASASGANQSVFCRVTSDSANVRRAPNGAVIGAAPNRTGFMAIEFAGEWARVQIRLNGPSSPLIGAGGEEPEAWIHKSQYSCS
jgi:hypothetical protein